MLIYQIVKILMLSLLIVTTFVAIIINCTADQELSIKRKSIIALLIVFISCVTVFSSFNLKSSEIETKEKIEELLQDTSVSDNNNTNIEPKGE